MGEPVNCRQEAGAAAPGAVGSPVQHAEYSSFIKQRVSFIYFPFTKVKMRSVVVNKFTPRYDDLYISEVLPPQSQPDHILIKVVGAGVNFVDTLYVRDAKFKIFEYTNKF